MGEIKQRIESVLGQIHQAEARYDRKKGSVMLLAVSKTWPKEYILKAAEAGQNCFGENYIQESIDKIDAIQSMESPPDIEWHFIGAIQSNKTKDIANRFQWIHSVDRLKIARRLSEQRDSSLPPLNICLQINISGEQSKSGIGPAEALSIAREINELPNIRLRGLMAIPAPSDDIKDQRAIFHRVKELQELLIHHGLPLDTLSMGMSGDMEAAIAEGTTMVRVGTAIFGKRNYPKANSFD
ncbi:YggS family pyridoxal phosphate-dependent enzyme [Pseudomonadota bacterium]